MKSLSFANNDQMPILGLGTWKSEPGEVGAAVREAVRIGYRHIDCAAIYGNETEIGKALKELISGGEVRREDLWITSKLWNNAHKKDQVAGALQKTLADLQLDYLDLYLMHWPIAFRPGVVFAGKPEEFMTIAEAPLLETWQAMEAAVGSGLTRHIGVSNFKPGHLETLCQSATIRPEMNQVELHPFLPQDELLEFCRKKSIHLTAYSPLGSGDRPGAMKKSDEPSLLANQSVKEIAAAHDCSPAQVLLAFAAARGTAVIPKSTSPDHLAENLRAADLCLTTEDMAALATLETGFRYVDGSFFTFAGSPYTQDWLWDDD
ncbi:MAG: aldehyde oxidoreductase [Desulfuromonas sp.]|nr:MAG: aldehyde oxidoreductase [Desulfuromonas sp.]